MISRDKTSEELLTEIERLQGFETAARDLNNDLIRIAGERDELAAHIQELEDALAEYQRLGKTIAGKVPCLTLHGDCGRCSAKMREVCGALEQIAGGKIGPEDVKPRSWQITEERKAVIMETIDLLNGDLFRSPYSDVIAVLRAMLEEAGQ
jgi:hypothetical protein